MFPKYELRSSSVSLLHLTPHMEYPARFHKQVEIGFVTEGILNLSVAGKEYRLRENDLYIAFPNLVHGITPSRAHGIVVIADCALFPAYQQKLTRLQPKEAVLHCKKEDGIVRQIMERLGALFAHQNYSRYEPIFLGYIGALLGEILTRMELEERSGDSDLLQSLMVSLYNSYTEDISLESISKELGYSKWYVSKLIAATFRCNFRFLVNSFRISMAQSLLLTSQKSVSDIAFECGFRNQSSFNRVFLSTTGLTPSVFRQMGGKVEKPQVFYR